MKIFSKKLNSANYPSFIVSNCDAGQINLFKSQPINKDCLSYFRWYNVTNKLSTIQGLVNLTKEKKHFKCLEDGIFRVGNAVSFLQVASKTDPCQKTAPRKKTPPKRHLRGVFLGGSFRGHTPPTKITPH